MAEDRGPGIVIVGMGPEDARHRAIVDRIRELMAAEPACLPQVELARPPKLSLVILDEVLDLVVGMPGMPKRRRSKRKWKPRRW